MLESILEVGALPGNTPIHRLWAGTKLIAVLAFGFGLAFSGQLWGFPLVAVLLLAAAALARLSPALLWRGLRPLLIAIVIGLVVLLLTTPGKPFWHIGPAVITHKGLENAVRFPGLLLLLALAAQIVNRTTAPADSVGALGVLLHPLRWLKVPVDELLTMVAISLRFLPILAEEVTRLRQAQATRGLSPGQGDMETRSQALQSWVVALIHANLRRAADLGEAMEARGYGDLEQREFPVRRPHLSLFDWAVLTLAVALSAAMIAIR